MCGRFTVAISPGLHTEIFGISILKDLPRPYNIAPTQQVLAIRGFFRVRVLWGLTFLLFHL